MPPEVIDGKTPTDDDADEIEMSPDRRPDGPILPGTAGRTEPLDEPRP